jgi:hypothetical protein
MKSIFTLIVLALTTCFTRAQHADIVARAEGGRIVTSGHIDATNEDIPGLRVFALDFGEDPLDPFFAADPGFNSPAGALPPGSQLRFDIPSAAAVGLPSNLAYWNGQNEVTFGTSPAGSSLRLSLGSQDRTISAGIEPISGFSIGLAGADGSLHRHLSSLLLGSPPAEPAPGIYLISLQLVSSDPSFALSDHLYLLYNNGLPEEAHDAAIEFVQSNLVPEPSCTLALILLSALVPRRRCRAS